MTEEIVKWINKNAEHLRNAVLILGVINLIIIGLAGCAGNLVYVFTHLLNIVFADVAFVIPMVYLLKFIKENN